jgi:hypothetical protein
MTQLQEFHSKLLTIANRVLKIADTKYTAQDFVKGLLVSSAINDFVSTFSP